MPSGSDVRGGGAYVETYVKNQKLDEGLRASNQKVAASVSLARASLNKVGAGTVASGALALTSIALVARAGMGFAKGFSSPTRQAANGSAAIVAAINRLQPALRNCASPLTELMSLFSGFGPKIVQNIATVRKALKSALSPEQYEGFDRIYKGLFSGSGKATSELKNVKAATSPVGNAMQQMATQSHTALSQTTADVVALTKSLAALLAASKANANAPARSKKPPKEHADYTQSFVKASYNDDGTIKRRAHMRVRVNKKKGDGPLPDVTAGPVTTLATASNAAAGSLAKMSTEITHVSERSRQTEADAKKLAATFSSGIGRMAGLAMGGMRQVQSVIAGTPAQWAASKANVIASLFGNSLERGMTRAAIKAADAARIQLAKEQGFVPGKIAQAKVLARKLIPAGIGAAIGLSLVTGIAPAAVAALAGTGGASIGATAVSAAVSACATGGPMIAAALSSKLVLAGAAGAAMVAKPRAALNVLARFTRGTFSAVASAIGGLGGNKAGAGLDRVGYAAMRAKGPLGQLSHVATGATSKLSSLAGVGTRLAGSWVKVGAISAGIVGALSAAAGFSTGSLSAAFTSFQDLNPAAITKTSQAIGLTVEQTSRLSAAAELSGSSMESVKGGLQHVNEMVKDGSGHFQKYGLSLEGMKNASPERRLELVSKALADISDPAKRAAAAVDLLGTNDLGPLMANFDGLRSKATLLGGVMSGKDVAAGMEFKNSLSEMHLASKSLGATLSAAVMPQLTNMVRTTTTIVSGVRQWAQSNRALIGTVFTVAKQVGLVAGIATAGAAIFAKFAFLGPIIGAALMFLTSPLGLVTAGIAALALSSSSTRTAAIEAFNGIVGGAREMISPVMETFTSIKEFFHEVFGGIVDALASGNLGLAAEIAGEGVKVAFLYAFAAVHGYLMDFHSDWVGLWDKVTANVRIAADDIFPGFEAAFSTTMLGIRQVWTGAWNFMSDYLDTFFGGILKAINYIKVAFDNAFDATAANKAIDEQMKKRAEGRHEAAGAAMIQDAAGVFTHLENLKTKGTKGTLEQENEEAKKRREESITKAKESDMAAIAAAKEKLVLSLERAKAERKTKEETVQSAVASGAETAKKGSEASRKGFEAQDVRSKEGLSALAGTARGRNPMDKQIDLQSKSLAEQKKQTDLQQKIWKQQQDGLVPAFPI